MKNRFIFFVLFFLICSFSHAQVEVGLRVGANESRSVFDNEVYKKFNKSKYKAGYLVGIVAVFENPKKEKYALQTEIYFSKMARRIKSSGNDFTENTAFFNYLHLPILFRVRFQYEYFDWYLILGPQISYWLGGEGVYDVYDPNYNLVNSYDYKINFDEPVEEFGYMNVSDFNKIQLGLSIGGGLLFELNDADRIAVDLRYYFGHTYLGVNDGGYIPFTGLTDNYESTNQSLELSVIYTFDIYQKLRYVKNKYK